MDGTRLQTLNYRGLAIAAKHIGITHQHFRPADPANPDQPLAATNLLGTMPANFNINGSYSGQQKANQQYWQIIADAAQLQIGDYLVGPSTYCVVAMDPILPPIALRCTQTLTFSRMSKDVRRGEVGYRGISGPNNAGSLSAYKPYARDIPGVLNVKKESGAPQAHLPGDNGLRTFYGAFFYLPNGVVDTRDKVEDPTGNTYQVISVSAGLLGCEAVLELIEN